MTPRKFVRSWGRQIVTIGNSLYEHFLRERWPLFGWFVMDFFKNIDVNLIILSMIESQMKGIPEIVDL